MKIRHKLKQILAIVLVLALTSTAFPLGTTAKATPASVTTVSNFDYFKTAYTSLSSTTSVFQTATYEDIVNLFKTSGTYVVLFGGAWDSLTQAQIGYINEVAKANGVSTIYNFDSRLDGKTSTTDISLNGNTYSYYYADLLNHYLTNLGSFTSTSTNDGGVVVDSTQNVYFNHTAATLTTDQSGYVAHIQTPLLFVYNKSHTDANGASAPIVSEINSTYTASQLSDASTAAAFEAQIKAVFDTAKSALSISTFDTINTSDYIKSAFNSNNTTATQSTATATTQVTSTYSYTETPSSTTIFDSSDGTLVYEHVTYDELIDILKSSGTYVILYGGSWCPNTQAEIKWANLYAKKYGISKIYFWDTKLNGGVSPSVSTTPHDNNDLQVRTNNHAFAFMYGDMINTYLTNITTQNSQASTPTVISYTEADGTTASTAKRLQVPYLFVYNKDNVDSTGESAPILGHTELMYSWQNIQPDYLFTKTVSGVVTPITDSSGNQYKGTHFTNLALALDTLFARLETVPSRLSTVAPTSATSNDGQITGTTAYIEYKLPTDTTWTAVTGTSITGLAPGTYDVRYAAKNGYNGPVTDSNKAPIITAALYVAGASVSVTVDNYTSASAPTGLTGIAPTSSSNNDGQISGTTTDEEFQLSGDTSWSPVTGTSITGLAAGTYYVRFAATSSENASDAATVTIALYTPSAPTGLTGVAPTSSSNNDGQITGTTTTEQYQLSGGSTWTTVTGSSVTGLASGTYNVRFAATAGAGASAATAVTVPAYVSTSAGTVTSGTTTTGDDNCDPDPSCVDETGSGSSVTSVSSASVASATDSSGTTKATVTASQVSKLITSAKTDETAGKTAVVQFTVDATSATKTSQLVIPSSSFTSLASSLSAVVKVNFGIGTVTFDSKAVDSISSSAGGSDVSISVTKVDASTLTDTVKQAVGDSPVYDFSVTAGDTKISTFGDGKLQISVPYTLAAGADPSAVVVYYIGSTGVLQSVRGVYNPSTETVNFTTTHFSEYTIKYNKVTFSDVSSTEWFSTAVGFIAARGITSGTDANNFSPNATLTRGQFIVFLLKAYNIAPLVSGADNYSDAGDTYYTNYLAAAKSLGITSGVGNNSFNPRGSISRQDLFTLLYRTLGVLNEVPAASASLTTDSFSDKDQIASYALDGFNALVGAGVISGSNNRLNPQGLATRAQIAQILYNLLSK